MFNKQQALDLVERAAWTFAQGFLAAWALSSFSLTKVAAVAGVAAGLSALKTFVKNTV